MLLYIIIAISFNLEEQISMQLSDNTVPGNFQQPIRNFTGRIVSNYVEEVDFVPNSNMRIWYNNKANNVKGKPRMTVVPADGLLFAQYNVGRVINGVKVTNADFYDQLAGDPFPGTSGVTEINDTLDLVNYRVYTGSAFNKGFEQIVEHDGVVSLRFINDFQAHRLGYCALGDANNDGSVDVTDIMTLVKVILHQPVPAYYPYNADMDANGQVNVTDVMSICNLLLGK